jgi:hypothetical protein
MKTFCRVVQLLAVLTMPLYLTGCFTALALNGDNSHNYPAPDKVDSITSAQIVDDRTLVVILKGDLSGHNHKGSYQLDIPLIWTAERSGVDQPIPLPRSEVRPFKKGHSLPGRSVPVDTITYDAAGRVKALAGLKLVAGSEEAVYSMSLNGSWQGLAFVQSSTGIYNEGASYFSVESAKPSIKPARFLLLPLTVPIDVATSPIQAVGALLIAWAFLHGGGC